MRRTFINNLIEIASKDNKVWLISVDIGFGVLEPFQEKFPERFLNVGIGEQNAVGIASGLAIEEQIPFVYTINSFLVFKAFEQIRMLAQMGQNEKMHCILVGTGIEDEYTNQGISHYSNGDKECLETLPIKILTPKTKEELTEQMNSAYKNPGVYYIRLSRFDKLPEKYYGK